MYSTIWSFDKWSDKTTFELFPYENFSLIFHYENESLLKGWINIKSDLW